MSSPSRLHTPGGTLAVLQPSAPLNAWRPAPLEPAELALPRNAVADLVTRGLLLLVLRAQLFPSSLLPELIVASRSDALPAAVFCSSLAFETQLPHALAKALKLFAAHSALAGLATLVLAVVPAGAE